MCHDVPHFLWLKLETGQFYFGRCLVIVVLKPKDPSYPFIIGYLTIPRQMADGQKPKKY